MENEEKDIRIVVKSSDRSKEEVILRNTFDAMELTPREEKDILQEEYLKQEHKLNQTKKLLGMSAGIILIFVPNLGDLNNINLIKTATGIAISGLFLVDYVSNFNKGFVANEEYVRTRKKVQNILNK